MDEEEDAAANGKPLTVLPDHLTGSMKIIQETYGSESSTLLTLYYVIFSEKVVERKLVSGLGLSQLDSTIGRKIVVASFQGASPSGLTSGEMQSHQEKA